MSQKAKLVLAVVILVVAAAYAVYQLTRPGVISNKVELVCVATGEVYAMSRDELIMIPAKNPDTNQRTLLPCHEKDGKLYVNERYRAALERLGDQNHYVDPETLAVRTSP